MTEARNRQRSIESLTVSNQMPVDVSVEGSEEDVRLAHLAGRTLRQREIDFANWAWTS
jgi:hypothetical protein